MFRCLPKGNLFKFERLRFESAGSLIRGYCDRSQLDGLTALALIVRNVCLVVLDAENSGWVMNGGDFLRETIATTNCGLGVLKKPRNRMDGRN